MKSIIIGLALSFIMVTPILAQTKKAQGSPAVSPSPAGNQVKNSNQVTTQNQGEDTQIEVQESVNEQEVFADSPGDGVKNRNQNAIEHMSFVAQEVERLLAGDISGGIGEQVREVARAQKQAQTNIEGEFTKLKAKTGFLKSLFGPDYRAIKNLNRQIEQNQLRIQELEKLAEQVQNQAEKTQIQAAIQAMADQNAILQNQVQAEEQVGSIFGWLVKFFNR